MGALSQDLHHSSPWAFQTILGFGSKLSGMENAAKDTLYFTPTTDTTILREEKEEGKAKRKTTPDGSQNCDQGLWGMPLVNRHGVIPIVSTFNP
jgi:hypothetical protein